MNFFITLIIALSLGFLLYKLGVPGGMMVGSILGVSTFNIVTGNAYFPATAKFLAQVIAGAYIGGTVNRNDLKKLPIIIKPFLLIVMNFLILNLVLGFLIFKISELDAITAFMCAIPGGMSDVPLIASDVGADAGTVAALQFIRMCAGVMIFPTVIKKIDEKLNPNFKSEITSEEKSEVKAKIDTNYLDLAIVLILALIFGYLGKLTKIPAGALTFSMIAIMILNLKTGKGKIPMSIKKLAQALSGAFIGSGIGREDLNMMSNLIVPLLLIILCYFINCILTGTILHRHFKFERKAAMLAATPAGASDMALISSDIGVRSIYLNVIQIMRMVVVVAIFPQIILFVVKFL